MQSITVIGGGLAGCEAALQLAARGVPVRLYEQRLAPPPIGADGAPRPWTPVHTGDLLAELVCSNSLKSTDPLRAQGLLKQELRALGSRLLPLADACAIPGGAALVVDRERFARLVTATMRAEPQIELVAEECTALPDEGWCILASGPLTGGALWADLVAAVGSQGSYFFDATSPVLDAASIDRSVVFAQSRYDKGGGADYLNCPFEREDYRTFREALLSAEQTLLHAGDDYRLFEGCLPVEELAARGENTLRFGPLKPKGLTDPCTRRAPWAAVQLRQEDALGSALSLVGFQTRLRQGEQERVFRMVPGLAQARFLRYGRMHRNSYLDAPRVLTPSLQLIARPQVLVAGQLTGLEGYMSALATGLLAGINAAWLAQGAAPLEPPPASCLGAMLAFMTNPAHKDYAPTAFQFGMLDWLPERLRKGEKHELIVARAHEAWAAMLEYLRTSMVGD